MSPNSLHFQKTHKITHTPIYIYIYFLHQKKHTFIKMDANDDKPKPKKKYVKKDTNLELNKLLVVDKSMHQQKYQDEGKVKYMPKQGDNLAAMSMNKDKTTISLSSTGQLFKQKEPIKYMQKPKEQPQTSSTILPVRDMIDDSDSRRLKKFLLEISQKADRIIIKYNPHKPQIIYEYITSNFKQTRPLRQILKANENMRKSKELVRRIYDALYRKVEEKYYEIGGFGLEVAERGRLRFLDRNFRRNSKAEIVKEYLFYFAVDGDRINFLMFDFQLNCVQFNTDSILNFHKQNPQNFEIYKQFQHQQLKNIKLQQTLAQNFGQQEVDSDQQHRANKIAKQKDLTIEQLRHKIKRIIQKDLQQFQQKIDQKQQTVRKLNNNNSEESNQRMEKLADEVMEEQASLDNFTETRDYVLEKLEKIYLNSQDEVKVLKSCLKRMILAEKQLISRLPIISRKRQIFQKLDKYNLLILEGETGSGKSTQLPQLLCQYYKIFQNDDALPVLITQPRKLATRSLAQRVASQMQQRIHGFVDYQTSLTTKVNEKAKIVFKMDRLVLDELKVDPRLSKYCCLVIDEAHERTISIDVILGLIKNLLKLRNDFKIIVTSASMDTELFKRYYKTEILKVSGRMFPVTEIFEPLDHEKDKTKKIIRVFNQRILDEHERNLRPEYRGHVLVFCSGIDQINQLCTYFTNKLNPRVFKVHALHGKLTPDQQRSVFSESPEHKLIFTTRIAQTSITIDRVRVVIDPGEDREMVYDQRSKVTTMKLQNISQSAAKQRAGRAGRTNQGYCFRLYSKKSKNQMNPNKTPEIQNMALDSVVLRLKSLAIEDIINFPYLSPPSKEGLQNSIEMMKMLRCLDEKTQKITTIGDFLVKIPIQPFLARAIIEAMLLEKVIKIKKNIINQLKMSDNEIGILMQINLVDEVIRILCMVVSSANLFYVRPEDRERAEKTKFDKLADESGDFFFLQKIYSKFKSLYDRKQNQQLRNWANNHFLSLKTLHQSRQLQRQISQIIKNYSINDQDLQHELLNAQVKLTSAKTVREAILACLVSSFATNLALHSNNEQIGYTIISLETPMQIYGTSTLSLQGISPKWILYYDLYENQKGQMYCKLANAVDFKFLCSNVNPYIITKFKIREAEKYNPFYEKITKKLPSLVFQTILSDYPRRYFEDNKKLEFLQQFSLNFYQDRNQIDFFFLRKGYQPIKLSCIMLSIKQTMNKYLKTIPFRDSKNPEQILQGYLKQIQQKYTISLKYNYVGPIYIYLKNGFQLQSIDLKALEHVYRITCSDEVGQWIVHFCGEFGNYELYRDMIVFRIVEEENVGPFKRTLDYFIASIKDSGAVVKYVEQLEDRRKKIPQAKLFIHFWAGTSQKNNIYLNYNGNPELQKQPNKQGWIQQQIQALRSLQKLGRGNRLLGCTFRAAKNKKGINLFYRLGNYDEMEVYEILEQYQKASILPLYFKMPEVIKKFRDPDAQYSSRSEREWENQVVKLVRKEDIKEDRVVVKAWGKNYYRADEKKISAFERNFKVEWHAEIRSFQTQELQKLKQKYDKQQNVLGLQKCHFKFEFQQVAVVTTQNTFRALQQQYLYEIDYTRAENPRVTVQHYAKTFRKMTKIYIKVRCQNRDEMLRPCMRLANLFTPKIIPLVETKFRFLDKLDVGNAILEDIQRHYGYKIYFAFDRKMFSLKVYCEDSAIMDIKNRLDKKMEQFKVFEKEISYRGKNLNLVKQKIEQKINQIRQNNNRQHFLNYQILFQFRKVRITADIKSCDQVQNQIMKIQNKEKQQCQICCDLIQKPYKLYVCSHEFCWACLSSYIRETIINTSLELLICPGGCQKVVSVYDVQKIMSEDQFNKLCDIQISRYIQKNPKFHGCSSANCENIFISAESEKQGFYDCDLCGKWYCYKCKDSHKGYSCDEWKNSKTMDESSLRKLGIKKCPVCGEGIQKNQGCQHMTCLKCKSHICWNCLKPFKVAKECYDHLAKECGGIFARQVQQ